MNIGTLIVLSVLTAAVVGIIFKLIKDNKAGKRCCGGDCGSCCGCPHSAKTKK
ncbi:MAG: FeoB-associated Cys-rich membrane protein [Clostridiales bacterium]|nr:FeoB-associated Cys-rich membrane protein [Clostridiales bacterium]